MLVLKGIAVLLGLAFTLVGYLIFFQKRFLSHIHPANHIYLQ